MKKPLALFSILFLVGCASPSAPVDEVTPSSPSPSESATVRPVLQVSDAATCETLLGSEDGQIAEAAVFLTELDDLGDEELEEAESIANRLQTVAESASPELSTLLLVLQEPFRDMIAAATSGASNFKLESERFKVAGNEVLEICEPLMDEGEVITPIIQDDTNNSKNTSPTDTTSSKSPSSEAVEEPEASIDSPEEPTESVSQANALRTANDYLNYTAFSKSGLIDQLIYEQYSKEDATWAVDRVSVDWNEQAAKMADEYLDYTSFSRGGLIDQLMYEGFSRKQAEYGVKNTGL